MKKFVSTALSTALCFMTVSPAWAQSSSFNEAWLNDQPAAVASFNVRVPLGGGSTATERPSYGVTLNYGYQDRFRYEDDMRFRPNAQLADLRFSGGEMLRAEVANLTLVDTASGRTWGDTLNMFEDGDSALWIVGTAVVAGLVICLLAECFEDDDDEEEELSSPS